MTGLLRTWGDALRLSSAVLLIWVCSGCRLPGGDSVAHIKGRWIGTIIAVTVYDDFGGVYEAAALEVERGSGYETPSDGVSPSGVASVQKRIGPISSEMGSGRLPLLVEGKEGIPTIIPAANLPVGRRVEVHGQTMKYLPLTPKGLRPPRTTPVSRVRPSPPDNPTGFEHVLVVRWRPKVVADR